MTGQSIRPIGLVAVFGVWLLLGICTTGADAIISTSQPVQFGHFVGARTPYYSNSISTFQYRLLIAGDIQPNPGPTIPINEHDHAFQENERNSPVDSCLRYDRNQLLNLNHNHYTVSPQVWHRLNSLEISAKRRTRRGTVGGKRSAPGYAVGTIGSNSTDADNNDNDNANRATNVPAVK